MDCAYNEGILNENYNPVLPNDLQCNFNSSPQSVSCWSFRGVCRIGSWFETGCTNRDGRVKFLKTNERDLALIINDIGLRYSQPQYHLMHHERGGLHKREPSSTFRGTALHRVVLHIRLAHICNGQFFLSTG